MKDKEIIRHMLRVINLKDREIIELLRRLPFENLSQLEQQKVILDDVGRTFDKIDSI